MNGYVHVWILVSDLSVRAWVIAVREQLASNSARQL